jgi:23S rRNA-/tRNA-specific pseudouridylate synthase
MEPSIMDKTPHLGFPVPLLGMNPVRLPVLFDDGELLALAKPVDVLVQSDAWFLRMPVLVEAIRHQSGQEKKEFQRLNIGSEGLWAITDLDPECHGPVLFSRNRDQAEALRSTLGSGGFQYAFTLLSKGHVTGDSLECSLPITRHRHQPRMLVSHTTGKKAATTFKRDESHAWFQQWTALAAFPRRHQILLHAMESGLPVLGDERYARDPLPLLSKLKRDYQPKPELGERPLFDGPAYFLHEIRLDDGRVISCPPPPRWKGLIKQLDKHNRP